MRHPRIARFAWSTLAFTLGVVAWGGYVRASGSGAGCGSHWPLCNGAVVPRAAAAETLIEFTHRATSGISFLLVAYLLWRVLRELPRPHPARAAAGVAVGFMVLEALVGAGLVKLGLVADNDSVARAVVLGVHLVNTFFLLGALALTAAWVSGAPEVSFRNRPALAWTWGAALIALVLVGVTGAVAALGDTLFPSPSLRAGLRDDLSPTAHILVRLRVLHPLLAVTVGSGVLLLAVSAVLRETQVLTANLGRLVGMLIIAQFGVGLLNLVLLAPISLQLVHLVMADLVWIGAVLLAAAQLGCSNVPGVAPQATHAATLATR